MPIGPVQIVAFHFERTDLFRGEIMTELGRLRRHGLIRVIDLFFAKKDAAGELMTVEMSQLSAEEKKEFGHIVRGLVGLGAGGAVEPDSDGAGPELIESAGPSVGLSAEDLKAVVLVAALNDDEALLQLAPIHIVARGAAFVAPDRRHGLKVLCLHRVHELGGRVTRGRGPRQRRARSRTAAAGDGRHEPEQHPLPHALLRDSFKANVMVAE